MATTGEISAVGARAARARLAPAQRATVLQFARFLAVGAVGYVVNLAVFAAAAHGLGIDFRAAAAASFAVAPTTTCARSRHFPFAAGDGDPAREFGRFALVILAGFATTLEVLGALVSAA